MQPKHLSALLVLLFLSLGLMAQNKIYFVEDITDDGKPIGEANLWAISPTEGGNIYVLYTNNNKPITDDQFSIKLDRKNDLGTYELFDELTVETDKGKTWLLFSLPFTEIGNYRITIQNAAKKNLAVENLELVFAQEEAAPEITDEYAKGYKITFCDSIDNDGAPVNPRKEFKLKKGKAPVAVYFSHAEGLLLSNFVLKITKAGATAAEPIELEITCDPTWGAFYYMYDFAAAGTYTVAVLTPGGKLLNFEMVTVK
jgi:hypothetical protein